MRVRLTIEYDTDSDVIEVIEETYRKHPQWSSVKIDILRTATLDPIEKYLKQADQ
jgi:hypothetical protein